MSKDYSYINALPHSLKYKTQYVMLINCTIPKKRLLLGSWLENVYLNSHPKKCKARITESNEIEF